MNLNYNLVDSLVNTSIDLGTAMNLKVLLEAEQVILEDGSPPREHVLEELKYKIAMLIIEVEATASSILDKMDDVDVDFNQPLVYN